MTENRAVHGNCCRSAGPLYLVFSVRVTTGDSDMVVGVILSLRVEKSGKQIGHSCLSHELDQTTLAWGRKLEELQSRMP